MSKHNHTKHVEDNPQVEMNIQDSQDTTEVENTATEEAVADLQAKVDELKARVAELEDLKLRQMAEFDNYRRRTNKEKLEMLDTAGERIFREMLPLIDDFERADDAMQKTDDVEAIRQGIRLIHKKFIQFLEKENVHVIETENVDFTTDEHEAITTYAAGEDKVGKIIDCTQKGYKLGEKVIRFAKVVVGE